MSIEMRPEQLMQLHQATEVARLQTLQSIQTQLQTLQSTTDALMNPSLWANAQAVSSTDTAHVTASYTAGAVGAAPGGYTIGVTQLARAQVVTQTGGIASAAADDTLSIAVGGGAAVNVAITAGDTLQNIVDKINATSGVGVFASLTNGVISLAGQTTGAANTIAVTSSGTLAADLNFSQTQAPLDANYTLNGVAQAPSASNTITNAISGVTLTLLGVTSSDASITVGSPAVNTNAVQTTIQSFVDAYNATIDLVNGQLTTQNVANPQTLTDATTGVLFGDPSLTQLMSSMREAVADMFSGQPASLSTLAQAGISTGAATGSGVLNQDSLNGKLTLDPTALTAALTSNPAGVKALFTNQTGSYSSEGMVQRFNGILDSYLAPTGVMATRISSEQSLIDMYGSEITDMNTRLAMRQQQLQQQFTNMEVLLGQSQATASYLGQQTSTSSATSSALGGLSSTSSSSTSKTG